MNRKERRVVHSAVRRMKRSRLRRAARAKKAYKAGQLTLEQYQAYLQAEIDLAKRGAPMLPCPWNNRYVSREHRVAPEAIK